MARWHTRIFDLAAERGWSDHQLAAALQVNYTTIWRYRKGHHAPSTDVLVRCARLFQKDVAQLWWPEPEREAV